MHAEELHNSVQSAVAVQSDIVPFVEQLHSKLGAFRFNTNSQWWTTLRRKCQLNQEVVRNMAEQITPPLNYYTVFHHVQEIIPKDAIIVSEGWFLFVPLCFHLNANIQYYT